MTQSFLALAAVGLLAAGTAPLLGQGAQPGKPPVPVASKADEMLSMWNEVGNKLVDMAKDFPEDKYDFKVQKDQRTFAQNILHVAATDYLLMHTASGTKIGPDFGKDPENPSRDIYKTKADVVKLIQQAVADGARLIKEGGDAGLDRTGKDPWANKMVRSSYAWAYAIEHSGEHYGQLVVYYRANGLVPPASR
jgi:uncharacterized damage-inducible protein DinB